MQNHENREAELGVLACALVDPDLVTKLIDNLTSYDFFHADLSTIFGGFKQLCLNLVPVDEITLGNYLKDPVLITTLKGGVVALPSKAHFPEYIKIVKEKSLLRQIVHDARAIAMTTKDGEFQPGSVYAHARALLDNIQKCNTQTTSVNIKVASDLLIEEIQKYFTDQFIPPKLATGWKAIDEVIQGLGKGELLCIAARPGRGKTSAALGITSYQCAMGAGVGFFSLEMTTKQLLERLYSGLTNIPLRRFSEVMKQEELDQVNVAKKYIDTWRLTLDDSAQTTDSLRINIPKMVKAHSLQLVVIDYFQRISSENRYKSDTEHLSGISQMLADMAKDLNIPILLLAQINRISEIEEKEPGLHNIKGCGKLEEDSHGVILLHRTKDPVGPGRYRTNFKIAKWRTGQETTIPMVFNGLTVKFTEQ